jgi:hypothetical protein
MDEFYQNPDFEILEINEAKKAEMLSKAKELLDKEFLFNNAVHQLEAFYIYNHGEHYTSEQLKQIVQEVFEEADDDSREI